MKNLKKVLAMVLAFACTFSMFAGAKVFEDVKAGSDYSEAITMLSDLGVIQGKDDGKYHPEDTITRAEACAMIARLMTGDPNVSQYVGAQSFVDVAKGSWKDSAIGYCYINGIVVGVGNNKFEPDRAITDAEFVTMVVRAMGYETADMKQNYPFSYMSNAQAIGLLDGVKMVANTDALRGEDAQVIYNALFTDYARGAKLVNTAHGTSVEQYPTLAESVWGLNRAGVGTYTGKDDETATLTNCKAHTWVVVGADKQKEGNILAYPIADDETEIYESGRNSSNGTKYVPYSFKYEGDVAAITGYEVELWGQGKHGQPTWEKGEGKFVFSDNWTIKAAKTVKGQTAYEYDSSKADSKSTNGTIELGETKLDLKSVAANADKIQMANTTNTGIFTYLSNDKYNGVELKKSEKNVEKALNVRDGAKYKLMDWDSDGDIDWIVIDEANYYKVESVTSKRLTVSAMAADKDESTKSDTFTWKLDDLNEEKNYKVKVVTPDDLKEGDVIEVTYKTAYVKSEKSEVITATVTKVESDNHELDKVSTKDGLTVTFDGDAMRIAENQSAGDVVIPSNPAKYADFDEEELGTQFALWQNRNGFIVYSDYATDSTNYMMVLDTGAGSDKTGDRKLAKVDFVAADNKLHKDVEVASDVRIVDVDGKTVSDAYNDKTRVLEESKVVGNVYKYWTDSNGKITKMQEMIAKKDIQSGKDYTYTAKNDRLTVNGESYALKGAKVVFAVTEDYIKHDSKTTSDLYVKSGDVLAVKQSDIPDIASSEDTHAAKLDKETTSWIANDNAYLAFKANKDKDISAAVLGVNNFNKFNAGTTKVGLVTNVSYDKNDVVSIDVAYNGKVDTISSAEKKDFDDIVSVYEYKSNGGSTTHSVKSRTSDTDSSNDVFAGKSLKNYLEKGAAYAEITTDADGKLTDVVFMDQKDDKNTVVGSYYQVSRAVITDTRDGWISSNKNAKYATSKKLETLDTKNGQVANDYASDAVFYTIDGRPTSVNGYSKAMEILDGFTSNPTIKSADKKDVQKSHITENDSSASDEYYVADIASKIDKDGKGDAVAVYMYSDEMGEVIGLNVGSGKGLTDVTAEVAVDGKATVKVDVSGIANLNTKDMYVILKSGNTEKKFSVSEGSNTLDLSGLPTGSYTVTLYGFNKSSDEYQKIGDNKTLEIKTTVVAKDVAVVADYAGTALIGSKAPAGGQDVYVKITGADASLGSKITVETDKSVPVSITAQGNSAGIYKLNNTSTWSAGTYNVFVEGKQVGTFEVAAAKVVAAETSLNVNAMEAQDKNINLTVTAMTAAQVKAALETKHSGTDTGITVKVADDAASMNIKTDDTVVVGTVKYQANGEDVLTINVQKVTFTLASKVVTDSSNSKVVVDLMYNGQKVTTLPAAIKAELETDTNWTYGGSNVNGAAVSTVAFADGQLTITAKTAQFNGQDVTVQYTASTNVEGISAF